MPVLRSWERRSFRTRVIICAVCVACCLVYAILCLIVDAKAPLMNGYFLFRGTSDTTAICSIDGGVTIGEDVGQVGCSSRYIVGQTVAPERELPWGSSFPPGYFLVDTETRTKQVGLTKQDLENLIQGKGERLPAIHGLWYWRIFRW